MEWAAGDGGKRLRLWLAAFRDRNAKAAKARSLESVQVDPAQTPEQSGAAFDTAIDRWESEVVHDGAGKAIVIDVVDYIDRLAFLVASAAMPSPLDECRKEATYEAP